MSDADSKVQGMNYLLCAPMGGQDFFLLLLYPGDDNILGQAGAEKAVIKEKFETK